MRFVSNQDMFILINDTLKKGDWFSLTSSR